MRHKLIHVFDNSTVICSKHVIARNFHVFLHENARESDFIMGIKTREKLRAIMFSVLRFTILMKPVYSVFSKVQQFGMKGSISLFFKVLIISTFRSVWVQPYSRFIKCCPSRVSTTCVNHVCPSRVSITCPLHTNKISPETVHYYKPNFYGQIK